MSFLEYNGNHLMNSYIVTSHILNMFNTRYKSIHFYLRMDKVRMKDKDKHYIFRLLGYIIVLGCKRQANLVKLRN